MKIRNNHRNLVRQLRRESMSWKTKTFERGSNEPEKIYEHCKQFQDIAIIRIP